jgi:aromatic ring hydroxylase
MADVLCSAAGGVTNMGAYHGGGSPVMEQIAITTQYDVESRKKLVRYIAGLSQGDREVLAPKVAKTKSASKAGKTGAKK